MAAIDDLTAVVTQVQTEQAAVDKAVSDLVAAVKAAGNVDPQIEAAVTALQAVVSSQTADAAQDPTP